MFTSKLCTQNNPQLVKDFYTLHSERLEYAFEKNIEECKK